jgi:hypothetical protein
MAYEESQVTPMILSLKIPSNEEMKEYYQKLGEFVYIFSFVERDIINLLIAESGLSKERANAVFSGVKMDAAKDHINRLRETRKTSPEENAELKEVFSHLTTILTRRNSLLHFGTNVFNGFESSNKNRVNVPDRVKSFIVSPSVLEKMTEDLYTISTMIQYFSYNATAEASEEQASTKSDLIKAPKIPRLLSVPMPSQHSWQYKPTQPTQRAKRTQGVRRKLPHPPEPSLE